jgi:hypothetical protein
MCRATIDAPRAVDALPDRGNRYWIALCHHGGDVASCRQRGHVSERSCFRQGTQFWLERRKPAESKGHEPRLPTVRVIRHPTQSAEQAVKALFASLRSISPDYSSGWIAGCHAQRRGVLRPGVVRAVPPHGRLRLAALGCAVRGTLMNNPGSEIPLWIFSDTLNSPRRSIPTNTNE